MPIHQVAAICKKLSGVQEKRSKSVRVRFQKINEIHKGFILADQTLTEQKHLSLRARCILIHRRFPELKISHSHLRQLYLANGITYKSMKSRKHTTQRDEAKLVQQRQASFEKLLAAKQVLGTVVYLDETIFQPFSITARSWAMRHANQILYKQSKTIKTVSAAVCITGRGGIANYILRERSIRAVELIELIDHLKEVVEPGPVTIFMDNLRAHHSRAFTQQLSDLGWNIIFNAPYSPQYHCIEEVFSGIKINYKRKIIAKNFQITDRQHIQIIRECLEMIQPRVTQKIEERHLQLMRQFLNELN